MTQKVKQYPDLYKEDVIRRQKEYLEFLPKLKNATVIYTIDMMCPQGKCFVYNGRGIPTRLDDEHLSFLGSEMLADKVLKPYLLEKLP